MAWDEIEANEDPNLTIQVYYARLNAIKDFLSTLNREIFLQAWETAAQHELTGLRRSALVGRVVSDLVRLLSLKEIASGSVEPGQWFVHSGVTTYSEWQGNQKVACITLPDGNRIRGTVRRECEITNTASGNMQGEDDVSFVVGRLLSTSKFDLIAAGYRDAIASLFATAGRTINLEQPHGNVIDTIRHEGRSYLPRIRFSDFSEPETLDLAVADTVDRFRRAVEDEGVWRHLYDGAKPAHESRHQALFRLFADMAFDALGIHIHPAADHGSGSTDLTLSLGESTHIVEFKKDHQLSKIDHGLRVQLPRYLRSARATVGTYVVMCHEREPREVEAFISRIRKEIDSKQWVIVSHTVDCRPQESASVAKPSSSR